MPNLAGLWFEGLQYFFQTLQTPLGSNCRTGLLIVLSYPALAEEKQESKYKKGGGYMLLASQHITDFVEFFSFTAIKEDKSFIFQIKSFIFTTKIDVI